MKKSVVKKAQMGKSVKPTADSTAYYDKQAKTEFANWKKERATTNKEIAYNKKLTSQQLENMQSKEKAYYKKANEAQDNSLRQSRKGKPGYDANGFPLKKKNGGMIKAKKK